MKILAMFIGCFFFAAFVVWFLGKVGIDGNSDVRFRDVPALAVKLCLIVLGLGLIVFLIRMSVLLLLGI